MDTSPPVVTCPEDIIEYIAPGQSSTTVVWDETTIVATDDSGTTTRRSRSPTPGSLFFTGPTTVTYVFNDPANNVGSCTFQVVIIGKSICTYSILCARVVFLRVCES